ncbi:hypothetical protein LINGRAPRIM_LOCUS3450 [Linum grandiflorum]
MVWVGFKYERLPMIFCYTCGRLGHGQASCGFKKEWIPKRYGEWLRAGINSPAALTPKLPSRMRGESNYRAEEMDGGVSRRREIGKLIMIDEEDMTVTRKGGWEKIRGTVSRIGREERRSK